MCKEAFDICKVLSNQIIEEYIFRYNSNTYSMLETEAERTFEKQLEDIKSSLTDIEKMNALYYYETKLRSYTGILLNVNDLVLRFKCRLIY
jgi:helix-turn-helix protein